jgi:uncharacterized protein YecT (DUF1311 family)
VEPQRDERVGGTVQRVNPTILAAIALGALILLIVGMMVFAGRDGEDDRLTGDEVTASREDPEQRCSSRATYDQIKRELFRRAAALRGSDEAVFGDIAGYSTIRMEAPALRDENAETDAVTCNGALTLDLPPQVAVVGGRRSLSADVLYTIQPAADGSGNVVTLANADDIITPLATLARTPAAPEEALNQVDPSNEVAVEPAAPVDPLAPMPDTSAATASPSFNCAAARSSGEVAVCNDAGLAALDRRMATQFASAMSDANAEQRANLQRTRDSFLRYRDGCPDNACIAETYRGRMREIRDIMLGTWRPRR